MSNFLLPKVSIFDTAGDPISGAKLYFYETSTSTPLATYADEDNTIANTNPVVCDAAGRAGPIWLQTDKIYKLVVKTSTDVTVYTVDPVKAVTVRAGTVAAVNTLPYVTPFMYGGVGDGVANDATPLQNAINAADKIVDLCGKTWKTNSQLTIQAGVTLQNGTLDFSDCAATSLIRSSGGSLGSTYVLTATSEKNARTATLSSTTGLSAGDFVLLSSSEEIVSGTTTEAQILRIDAVVSSTVVRFETPIDRQYAIGSGAIIRKITQVADVELKNLILQCGNGASQKGVLLEYCNRAKIQNLVVNNINLCALEFSMCFDSVIDGLYVDTVTNASGVGVWVSNASSMTHISNAYITTAYTGVVVGETQYGPSRDVYLKNIEVHNITNSGVSFGASSKNCTLDSFIISGKTSATLDGETSRGVVLVGEDCFLKSGSLSYFDTGVLVASNFSGTASEPLQNQVQGVSFVKCFIGVSVDAVQDVSSLHVSDCYYDGPSYFLAAENQNASCDIKNVYVKNIHATGSTNGYPCISFANPNNNGTIENIFIENVRCTGFEKGFYFQNCSKVFLKNAVIESITSHGVHAESTESSTHTLVVENVVVPSAGLKGVFVQGPYSNVEIKSCQISGTADTPIVVSSTDSQQISNVRVLGCVLTTNSSYHGVYMSPNDANALRDVFITNNTLMAGRGLASISKALGLNVIGNSCREASSSGVAVSQCQNIFIDNFTVLSGAGAGISVSSSERLKATNLSLYSTGTSIYIENTPNTHISNVDTLNSTSTFDINVVNSGNTFVSNVKSSCTQTSFQFQNSDNINLHALYSDNGTRLLNVINCDYVFISDGNFQNASDLIAVFIQNSAYVSLVGCLIRDFQQDGLYFNSCSDVTVNACNINGVGNTSITGVVLYHSSNVKIKGCEMSEFYTSGESGIGVYIEHDTGDGFIDIYSNNFHSVNKGIYINGVGSNKDLNYVSIKNNLYTGTRDFVQINSDTSNSEYADISIEGNTVYILGDAGALFGFTTTGSLVRGRIANNTAVGGQYHTIFTGNTVVLDTLILNNYHKSEIFVSPLGESTSGTVSGCLAHLNYFHYTGGSFIEKGNGSISLTTLQNSVSGAVGVTVTIQSNVFAGNFT